MKNLKKSGISLIVLVITIIVMIILAAAIILSLNSSNIVGKAQEAKTSSDTANIKHAATVAYSEYVLDKNEGKVASGMTAEEYVKAKLLSQGIAEANLKRLMVSEKGKIFVVEIPEGFVASTVSTEDDISEGLVIRDKNKNEFVWVPVYDFSKFQRTTTYDGTITPLSYGNEPATKVEKEDPDSPNLIDLGTLSLTNDLTGEWAEYTAMRASVKEHGGFYIARYEAGKDGTDVVVSKKDATVWTRVPWGISIVDVDSEGAVYLSRKMYENSKSFVSTLIYGVQWDAALQFIAESDATYPTNSLNKGNYANIGTEEYPAGIYSVKNIYDMAGNAGEWTMEQSGSTSRYYRGRAMTINDGSITPACSRDLEGVTTANNWVGFRVALYLK